jgi:hypothetical protein
LAEFAAVWAVWTDWFSVVTSWLSFRIFWCCFCSSSERLEFAVVFESTIARVSRFDVSREAMRARSVSISESDVVPEDLRVWSSFSRDRRVCSELTTC